MNISFNHIYGSLVNGNSYSITKKQTKQFEDETAQSNSKLAKKLRDACRALNKSDFTYGATTNITLKLEKFADSYNKLAEAAKKSDDKDLNKLVKNMKNLIEDNKAALNKAGITYDDKKNSLSLNAEKIEKIKTGKVYEGLFGSNVSFSSKMQKYAEKAFNLLKNEVRSEEVPVYEKIDLSDNSRNNALAAGALFSNFTALFGMDYTDSNLKSIQTLLVSFTEKYNELVNSNIYDEGDDEKTKDINKKRKELMDNIKDTNSEYSAQLSGIGINVEEDGTLTISGDEFDNASVSDIGALFAKGADYGDIMSSNFNLLFGNLSGASGTGQTINITA